MQLKLLFFAALAAGIVSAPGAILEDIVRQGYDVSATGSLSVQNSDGRIYIYGSDAPRVEIQAMRRAFSEARLQAIEVRVTTEGEAMKVETIYPPAEKGMLGDRSGTVDYVILVPQKWSLAKVELERGEVLIEGMYGPRVEVAVGRGLLHLNSCFSTINALLGEGRLSLFYEWWESQPFSLAAEVRRGSTRVGLPAGADLHVDAATENGRVINHLPVGKSVEGGAWKLQIGEETGTTFRLRMGRGNCQFYLVR